VTFWRSKTPNPGENLLGPGLTPPGSSRALKSLIQRFESAPRLSGRVRSTRGVEKEVLSRPWRGDP
jgi:hypothetical protein